MKKTIINNIYIMYAFNKDNGYDVGITWAIKIKDLVSSAFSEDGYVFSDQTREENKKIKEFLERYKTKKCHLKLM